jgi:hypothetical protein
MTDTPKPVFPLTVKWPDAEPEVFMNEREIEVGLEFFSTYGPGEDVEVLDSLGREVDLVVEKLALVECTLKWLAF